MKRLRHAAKKPQLGQVIVWTVVAGLSIWAASRWFEAVGIFAVLLVLGMAGRQASSRVHERGRDDRIWHWAAAFYIANAAMSGILIGFARPIVEGKAGSFDTSGTFLLGLGIGAFNTWALFRDKLEREADEEATGLPKVRPAAQAPLELPERPR